MSNHTDDRRQSGLNPTLSTALDLLDEACSEIYSSGLENKKEIIREIGMAVGYILMAGSKLPGFHSTDELETPEPDGELSEDQQARVDQLSSDELRSIDEGLLSHCSSQFRKVARVVGSVMMERDESYKGIPDIFLPNESLSSSNPDVWNTKAA